MKLLRKIWTWFLSLFSKRKPGELKERYDKLKVSKQAFKKKPLTNRQVLALYLKKKGYAIKDKPVRKDPYPIPPSPYQGMRLKMSSLLSKGQAPKPYYERNKWGIKWLLPYVPKDVEIVLDNGDKEMINIDLKNQKESRFANKLRHSFRMGIENGEPKYLHNITVKEKPNVNKEVLTT